MGTRGQRLSVRGLRCMAKFGTERGHFGRRTPLANRVKRGTAKAVTIPTRLASTTASISVNPELRDEDVLRVMVRRIREAIGRESPR